MNTIIDQVYYKDCKYFYQDQLGIRPLFISCDESLGKRATKPEYFKELGLIIPGEISNEMDNPFIKNKNNDCKSFKPIVSLSTRINSWIKQLFKHNTNGR